MKDLFCRLMRLSGLLEIVRRAMARRRVTIILFHSPTPETLREHLTYLITRYQFIDLDRVIDALEHNSWSSLPDYSMVLTLDDGHSSNRDLVPVLREFGITGTIYVCSAIVNTKRRFWFLDARATPRKAKRMRTSDRVAWLREEGVDILAEYGDRRPDAMTYDEMREAIPTFSFQCHSRTHPILTMCTDDEAREEIVQCRKELEKLLGTNCCHYAYPNGDYLGREIELVKEAGFASARTINVGRVGPRTSRYELPCMGVSDDASLDVMIAQVSGIIGYLSYVKRGSFFGRYPTIRPGRAMP